MAGRDQRLTVIVIPETGKRTFSFRFSPLWSVVAGGLVLGLVVVIGVLTYTNKALRQDLVELNELKKVNRLQEAEIETIAQKAQESQEKLDQLKGLEQQVRELTGQSTAGKTSRGDTGGAVAQQARGRGGPLGAGAQVENLPTLSGMIPPEVGAHLFAQRDTLPLHMRQISAYKRDSGNTLNQAQITNALLTEQIKETEQLAQSLAEGKEALVGRLNYLAHRPSGMPVSGADFTDRFGWRWSPFGWGRQFHSGLDLAQDYWTPIVSTGAGIVTHAGWRSGGYGYAVVVDHGYGFQTLYAHMIDWDVKIGQEVQRGTRLGWVGSTGNSTGAHLHYEVYVNGVAVDPVKYLQ